MSKSILVVLNHCVVKKYSILSANDCIENRIHIFPKKTEMHIASHCKLSVWSSRWNIVSELLIHLTDAEHHVTDTCNPKHCQWIPIQKHSKEVFGLDKVKYNVCLAGTVDASTIEQMNNDTFSHNSNSPKPEKQHPKRFDCSHYETIHTYIFVGVIN